MFYVIEYCFVVSLFVFFHLEINNVTLEPDALVSMSMQHILGFDKSKK